MIGPRAFPNKYLVKARAHRAQVQDRSDALNLVDCDKATLMQSGIGPRILDLIDFMEPVSVDLRNGLVKAVNKWEDEYGVGKQEGEEVGDAAMSGAEARSESKGKGVIAVGEGEKDGDGDLRMR